MENINENVLVAQSDPKEKELMIQLIAQLIINH